MEASIQYLSSAAANNPKMNIETTALVQFIVWNDFEWWMCTVDIPPHT